MATEVRHNPDRSRYEIFVDGEFVGLVDCIVTGDRALFPHTEIAPRRRGQGLGEQLVRAALDDQRRAGRRVVPQCWFVAQFIDEHQEYADLVAA